MTSSRLRFSLVSAVYNVEPYLPDFIASIEAQAFDLGRVEVIAVDDGSTDGSAALLAEWAKRRPDLVTVVTQANAGQAAARNAGLARATGEWVTFPDPDDTLDPGYLATADAFAVANPDVEILAAQPILLIEETGRRRRHPRHRQYRAGNRTVDLRREPTTFPGSTAVSLYNLDRVRSLDLRLDPRIRPAFEDGHFTARFLLDLPAPVVGMLADARYTYRKRAAGTSTLQRSWADPGRYDAMFEHGYLDLVARARSAHGAVPAWLQHLLVYELSWYLAEDAKISTQAHVPPELDDRFHAHLAATLAALDPTVVRAHDVRFLKPTWVDLLAHGGRPEPWRSAVATRRVDRAMRLQRVAYRFTGDRPAEEIRVRGRVVDPVAGKVMSHLFFGRALLQERIAWVPAGPVEVRVEGRILEVVAAVSIAAASATATEPDGDPAARPSSAGAPVRRAWVIGGRVRRALSRRRADGPASSLVPGLLVRLLARSWPARRRYRDAWAVMDRLHDADDNGERLFEHLRAERPDINAWFVLERGTPDWKRLRAAGTARLVAHGSLAWLLLMLNCRWLLSSHADLPIMAPPAVLDLTGRPTWKFGFLQHGVIKDDLSRWLNRRRIDLFVVSTEAEHASVVADGTAYEVTALEARNTGLPRFDRLLAKARAVSSEARDLVLVSPTWRSWLAERSSDTSQRRDLDEAFWQSDYLRRWLEVLRSPEVAAAAARRGLRIGFMPHPNLQGALPELDLPPHVERLAFAGADVQGLYARTALLVTDYSSVAFNVAYVDGPVVYYQFDRDIVLAGGHVGRRGYFEYERDGFGPVVTDAEAAVQAIVAAIERGPRPAPEFQARIDRTFTNRDGQSCARVVAAVEELSRPYRVPTAPTAPPGGA